MSNKSGRLQQLGERLFLLRLPTSGYLSLADSLADSEWKSEQDRWLIIIPEEASWSPWACDPIWSAIGERPDAEIFYADEVENPASGGSQLILKPTFDITHLLAKDYIGFPLIIKNSVFMRIGEFRSEAKSAAPYDLVLRAHAAGVVIDRIPDVLVAYPSTRRRSTISDRHSVLVDWLAKNATDLEARPGLTEDSFGLERRFPNSPDVTLVVPTRQSTQTIFQDERFGRPHIINLLESLEKTDWPMSSLRVIIGDDVEDDEIYRGSQWKFAFDRIHTKRPEGVGFNYAAKMNALWRSAETEHIVLLNDDVVVQDAGWLKALLTFSMKEEVGGVGARLMYASGNVQHAGIAGLFDQCAHAWLDCPSDMPTYEDWALVHREWSMVTGAVFATRKSVMTAVSGFDERFEVEYNDVDLCLRLRLLGYQIVYTPFAKLLHYEKSSRGAKPADGSNVALFLRRWREYLENDPFSNPRIDKYAFALNPIEEQNPWYDKVSQRR